MNKIFIFFILSSLCILPNKIFAQSDTSFCNNFLEITQHLLAPNDWLISLKGKEVENIYYTLSSNESKICFSGAIGCFVSQKWNALSDSAGYFFHAVFLSQPSLDSTMQNRYEEIKTLLQNCLPDAEILHDMCSENADGDGYFTLNKENIWVELNLYNNSLSRSWIIYLRIENKRNY